MLEPSNEDTIASIRFLYVHCTDLDAMRHFYTTLVGLDEIYYSDSERTVAYNCDGLQFTIREAAPESRSNTSWAWQPGWEGGEDAATSWSVTTPPEDFSETVSRLRNAGVPAVHEAARWVGYWSFPVKDPMGTTVEITSVPHDPPQHAG